MPTERTQGECLEQRLNPRLIKGQAQQQQQQQHQQQQQQEDGQLLGGACGVESTALKLLRRLPRQLAKGCSSSSR
ncbi:hypothetical protein Emag_007670 [Eimeria magna]